MVQYLNVIAAPGYLTGGLPSATGTGAGGAITFNSNTYQFSYNFTYNAINDTDTVDELLKTDSQPLPIIGNEPDQLLVAFNAVGTGGLNPMEGIPLTVSGHLLLELAGAKVFDKTYQGGVDGTATLSAQMILSGQDLDPGTASLSFQVTKFKLFTVNSPTLTLFSFGIPNFLGVDLGLKVGLSGTLSGGVKIGNEPMDDYDTQDFLDDLGIMSPTFIQASITGTASLVGDATLAGFSFVKVTGSLGLTLAATVGLDNADPDAVFPLTNAADDLAFDLDASLTVGVQGSVPLIGNIFNYSYTVDLGNIYNTVEHGIFLSDPPSMATGKFIAPGEPSPSVAQLAQSDTSFNIGGSSLVGAYTIDPTPQIVIDNSVANALGLSAQLVNAGTSGAPLGNIDYATRTAGNWSALSPLTENNDVADPVLALSHDNGTSEGAVMVYDADNVAGSPATQTINQRLDAEDIRYRYYNGTSWGSELTLTNDNLYDSGQSIAFDATGAGVLAYVHNTDSAPVSSSGDFDASSTVIEASAWNPSTHTFAAPIAIPGSSGGADGAPSTFVDASGHSYIVWTRALATGNELMYSINTGSGWSTAAVLGVTGLPAGGSFDNVALGSDGTGRLNTIFSYSVTNADGSIATSLFDRPATTASFTNSLPAVQISTNANYSDLRTTNAPSGALVAYWEQSDGSMNQIFETTITQGVASTPTQITDDPNVASEAMAAVDSTGTLQVLYDNDVLYGGTSQGSPTDPTVGAPMSGNVASSSIQDLPQLTFSAGLSFPTDNQSGAPIGSQITGTAVVANRGLASATVTLKSYDGLPATGTQVGSTQTFNLLPGASYNVSQIFTVLASNQTYSMQVTTSSGQAFDTTENTSSTTLNGLVDIQATELTDDASSISPGSAQTLEAFFQNNSTAVVGPFTVTLYSGDLYDPQFPVSVLATQTVTGMTSLQQDLINFPVTIPAGAGDDVYTFVVDSGAVITESDENNNEARFEVDFQADPAVTNSGSPAVAATLLNSSTANNVQVTVDVSNLGPVNMTNIPVDLVVSRNGGTPTSLGQMVISELDAGASTTETFTVTSLAGDNVYAAAIDPSAFPQDSNLSNDIGSADLYVPGLAQLGATVSLSSGTVAAGGPLTMTANVTNAGLADADNVPLTVLAALSSGGPSVVVGTGVVSVIGLGTQSVMISLNTTGLASGTYTLTLEIDPGQLIPQSSQAGNTVTTTVIIGAPAPLVLSGPDEYLRLDADGLNLDIWNATTNAGAPAQKVLLSTISGVTYNAPSGVDFFAVDFSAGDPLPAGSVTFSGGSGQNTLELIGTSGNDTFVANAATVTFNALSISLTDVQALVIDPGLGADSLTVNAGIVTLPAGPAGAGLLMRHLTNLTIAPGAQVSVSHAASSKDRTVLVADSISIAGTARLDLSNNDLIVHNGNTILSQITAEVALGYGGGHWNGLGIDSSAAAVTNNTALGTILNSTSGGVKLLTTFDGQSVSNTDVLIKYTFYGDANLDGVVNGSDYTLIDNGFNNNLIGWRNGDFNYDGVVNGDDYSLIDNAFNTQGASLAAQATALVAPALQAASTGAPEIQIQTKAVRNAVAAAVAGNETMFSVTPIASEPMATNLWDQTDVLDKLGQR